jgi:hypothetical protein
MKSGDNNTSTTCSLEFIVDLAATFGSMTASAATAALCATYIAALESF